MSDKLSFAVDGIPVRDTDLTQFRTFHQVKVWKKGIKQAYSAATLAADDAYFDFLDALDTFAQPRIDAILNASEERKLSMPARNLDLIVIANEDRDPSLNYGMKGKTVLEIGGLLDCFDRAEQMTSYEFDAYETLGEDECDRQEIETLHDMFGTEWAEAFYKRKNSLIAKSRLLELYAERRTLTQEIEKYEAML